jgi:DNA-binding MarR family transcriptional regulator
MLVPVIDETGGPRAAPADCAEDAGWRPRADEPGPMSRDDDFAGVPADASLWELLVLASRTMGAYWWHTAQDTGVSPAGLGVLRMLAIRDGLKSSEVAARGVSTPGTVTSVVDTLVRDGLVERRRDDEDRRVVRLYLTGEGRRKLDEAGAILAPKWRNAFDYVAPADEPVVRRFLVDTIERFGLLIRKERGT